MILSDLIGCAGCSARALATPFFRPPMRVARPAVVFIPADGQSVYSFQCGLARDPCANCGAERSVRPDLRHLTKSRRNRFRARTQETAGNYRGRGSKAMTLLTMVCVAGMYAAPPAFGPVAGQKEAGTDRTPGVESVRAADPPPAGSSGESKLVEGFRASIFGGYGVLAAIATEFGSFCRSGARYQKIFRKFRPPYQDTNVRFVGDTIADSVPALPNCLASANSNRITRDRHAAGGGHAEVY